LKRLAFALGFALAGTSTFSAEAPSPNLHNLMKNVIAVQAQVIWDIGNRAQDDHGDVDPKKLTAADWAKMSAAADKVKQAAQSLASAAHVAAAAAGQKLQDEGNPGAFGAADVQKVLDAQPKVLNAMAQALVNSMDQIQGAIARRDGRKVGSVSGDLDEVCEACHKVFWYPNQK
jgi:cytochrome c556